MAALTLKNVSYRYQKADKNALEAVSCAFEAGKLSAVVGPSGSGKTTLLSILAGLDRPTAGKVLLGEQNLAEADLDKYRQSDVSIIFQAFQLFPLLTVMENVCFPMELAGEKKPQARAKELLQLVGIGEDKHKRYPANLSGGEQQRVAIARALASGAKILLADEPTGNLDEANTQNIVELLLRLAHEQGYCVIVVTHDMDIAAKADEVYRMRDGALSKEA